MLRTRGREEGLDKPGTFDFLGFTIHWCKSAEKSSAAISCYPNAGLPNPLSPTGFDLLPEDMGRYLGEFARAGLVNIAGGCCGNTPEHIPAIAKALEGLPPRELKTDVAAEPPSASPEVSTLADGPRPLRL